MNYHYIQTKLDPSIKTVGASFGGSNIYTYKTRQSFKVGEFGVVRTQDEYKIVEIKEVHKTPEIDKNATFDYGWIHQKVNTEILPKLENRDKQFKQSLYKKSGKEELLDILTRGNL